MALAASFDVLNSLRLHRYDRESVQNAMVFGLPRYECVWISEDVSVCCSVASVLTLVRQTLKAEEPRLP